MTLKILSPLQFKHYFDIPEVLARVQAGFPSPADDYEDEPVTFENLVKKNGPTDFFVELVGESMIDLGIFPGDVAQVNKALEPKNGDVVIVAIDNEFTCKQFYQTAEGVVFKSANPEYPDFSYSEDDFADVVVWGVVTAVVRRFRQRPH